MKDAVFVTEVFNIGRLKLRILTYLAFLIVISLPFLVIDWLPAGFAFVVAFCVVTQFLALIFKDTTFGHGHARWRMILGPRFVEVIPNGWEGNKQRLAFSELKEVRHIKDAVHGGQLIFETDKTQHAISTLFLDRKPQEILRLIEIRLEQDGRYLAQQDNSGKTQIWTVAKGQAYSTKAQAPLTRT